MDNLEAQCLACPQRRTIKTEEGETPQILIMPDGETEITRTETCPPQTRSARLHQRLNNNIPSAANEEEDRPSYTQTPNGELSLIKQDTNRYGCPLGKKRLLIDSLTKRINPGGNSHFNPNSGIAASARPPGDTQAREYTERRLFERRIDGRH